MNIAIPIVIVGSVVLAFGIREILRNERQRKTEDARQHSSHKRKRA